RTCTARTCSSLQARAPGPPARRRSTSASGSPARSAARSSTRRCATRSRSSRRRSRGARARRRLAPEMLGAPALLDLKEFSEQAAHYAPKLALAVLLQAAGVQGVVREIDFRKTRIMDDAGHLHVIPNRLIEGAEWIVLER